MSKPVIVKILTVFLTGGLVALSAAGILPVAPEVMNSLCVALGTAFGGSFVNAKQ